MTDASDNATSIKVDVGLKAVAEVKAEVPTASVGRFVDALTDLIRPWTEARGLKADHIRVHREEVALKIARLTAERIKVENLAVRQVDLKILVPLLEKGSQEEIDDDFMISMWSELLASAATSSKVSPRFVAILGELNSRQAHLLIEIARNQPHATNIRDDEAMIASLGRVIVGIGPNAPASVDEQVAQEIAKFGYYTTMVTWTFQETGAIGGHVAHEDSIDLDILASLSLVRRNRATDVFERRLRVTHDYVTLTMMGATLLNLVRSLPAGGPRRL